MKYIFIILLLSLNSCAYLTYETNAAGIISFAQEKQEESHVQNLLWYRGRKDGYDYFTYVYSMLFYQRNFKVKAGEIEISESFDLTSDYNKYQQIESINVSWEFWTSKN